MLPYKIKKGKVEDLPGLDINKGKCVFPFMYKDEEYNERCYPGKKGEWCATKVNSKTNTVRKWAYCLKPGEANPLNQGAPAPEPVKKKLVISTKKKAIINNLVASKSLKTIRKPETAFSVL